MHTFVGNRKYGQIINLFKMFWARKIVDFLGFGIFERFNHAKRFQPRSRGFPRFAAISHVALARGL